MGAFGERFKREREKRKIALDDVAKATKIGTRMLQAIEDERFDRLPGGVFNKGFIRTYAKHLGLNDEDAIAEYLEALRLSQAEAQSALAARQSGPPSNVSKAAPAKTRTNRAAPVPVRPTKATKPQAPADGDELPHLQLPKAEHVRPRRLMAGDRQSISWSVPALVVVVIVAGIYLWNRHSRGVRAEGASSAPAAVTAPLPAQAVAAPSVPSQSAAPQSTPAQSTAAPSSSTPLPKTALPTAAATPKDADENDVTTKTPKAARPTATTAEPQPTLTLVIRAAASSWVSVTADGQHVTQETLIAPAHTSVRASREIVVKAGNAAGVSFTLNGKEIPPQGTEGEVKTLVFDETGLRAAPTPQTAEPAR